MVPSDSPIEYSVDSNDRLKQVNASWVEAARQVDATALLPEALLGQSLWRYVRDSETRRLYRLLLAKVRDDQQTIVVTFRCDTPAERRYMELTMRPLSHQGVGFCSQLRRREPRSLDSAQDRIPESLRICGRCKRLYIGQEGWVEVEQALAALRLFDAYPLPPLEQAICPKCLQQALEVLGKPG